MRLNYFGDKKIDKMKQAIVELETLDALLTEWSSEENKEIIATGIKARMALASQTIKDLKELEKISKDLRHYLSNNILNELEYDKLVKEMPEEIDLSLLEEQILR